MFLQIVLLVLAAFYNCVSGEPTQTSPPSSTAYSNTSTLSIIAASQVTPKVCCFVAQDTASAIYWPIIVNDTQTHLVNVTSLTTYITPYPNGTTTRVVTNVHTQNETFTAPFDRGMNPLVFYDNADSPLLPYQNSTEISMNITATVTGGVTVKSPQAFFVYSTLKIITAAPVTDGHGNVMCGTTSSWDSYNFPLFPTEPMVLPTWPNINGNAELYFGNNDIVSATDTESTLTTAFTQTHENGGVDTTTLYRILTSSYWINTLSQAIQPTFPRVVAEIVLATPFIYQPSRGATGATESTACFQSTELDLYGYIPQTLVDYMAARPEYVTQYPNIASCLPAGPYIEELSNCITRASATSQTAIGGDLTRSVVITITPSGQVVTPTAGVGVEQQITTDAPRSSLRNSPSGGQPVGSSSGRASIPAVDSSRTTPQAPETSVGAIINSFIGGNTAANGGGGSGSGQGGSENQQDGKPSGPTLITPPPAQPITIAGPTEIPLSQAPPGLVGQTTTIDGSSFLVVSSATTLAPLAGGIAIPVSFGSSTFISGTPVFIIPSATTVPAAGLPSGLGSTTVIGGTPFVVIQPTEFPIPAAAGAQIFSTTVINQTPFLYIPGPTSIPVTAAPPGLTGSITVVGGTSFFVIPTATSVPALPGHVTIIDGSTFVAFDGSTTVAFNPHLPFQGIETVISGTTMIIIPGATTVPFLPGSLTLISNTLFDVFTTSLTVPVNPQLPLVGETIVISGTTEVILPAATTVLVMPGGTTSASSIYIMASGARRGRVSWIGFALELVRGFNARFRR